MLGQVKVIEGRKRFVPNSPPHLQVQIDSLPMGKPISLSFEEHKATRSQQQLAYHWVLIGYLARHTGYTTEEMHDAVMRLKFKTKKVVLGDRIVEVRRSISEASRMPAADAVELIDFDLNLCHKLGIVVPTKEELGYMNN